ncbi:MAG: hypothetical protein HY704_05290 [Gemmatimonadetes bacterium]|nr:hypothetical protein [Gemmatimonadota bacterium]
MSVAAGPRAEIEDEHIVWLANHAGVGPIMEAVGRAARRPAPWPRPGALRGELRPPPIVL